MQYSEEKKIFGKLCMCETGKLWFDGKDMTDKLIKIGMANSLVKQYGTEEQYEKFREVNKGKKRALQKNIEW